MNTNFSALPRGKVVREAVDRRSHLVKSSCFVWLLWGCCRSVRGARRFRREQATSRERRTTPANHHHQHHATLAAAGQT